MSPSGISRSGKPAVVAHRGASGELAEHTLAAYDLALSQGADGLECDVRLTADEELVCVHDRTIDRTSDGVGVVSEMTLSQLQEHDFGSWHSSGKPASVLTLRELLTMTLDWHRPVRLFIETKHPVRVGSLVELKLMELLREFGVGSPPSADHSRAVVISFSAAGVWRVRRTAPMLPTILL
ncbi:MAG: glycerophosphodiester phosphodiesterase family protein, partial [Gordonia sp. (in: high G+C Gram-positive bacteria)]